MDSNKNFNELLIEILKQIHVRLDRLDAKIDTKADKEDVNALKEDISEVKADLSTFKESVMADISAVKESVTADINVVKEDVNSLGQRLDRIETGIATLRWLIGAQVAVIGVILAIFKAF